jgi:hypothetical protein
MEPRGRNGWQTFGSLAALRRLDLGETVATGCHRLPFGSHGKEGSTVRVRQRALAKGPQTRVLLLSLVVALLLAHSGMEQVLEQPGEEGPNFVA